MRSLKHSTVNYDILGLILYTNLLLELTTLPLNELFSTSVTKSHAVFIALHDAAPGLRIKWEDLEAS